jgi:hypothetical protein
MASTGEIFARLDIKNYLWDYDDVTRMNKLTNSDVKCVATLETQSNKIDKHGQASIGSKEWFLRNWKILNPEEDTTMTKRHRDGLFDDMKKKLELSDSQHFAVDVDYTDGISNSVVFYIDEILTKLAGKYKMTLAEALQTIHDTRLGREKMSFINEAFDDQMDLRNPPAKRRRIDTNLSHLQMLLEDLKNLRE